MIFPIILFYGNNSMINAPATVINRETSSYWLPAQGVLLV